MRRFFFALMVSLVAALLLAWTVAALGGEGVAFAFLIVWVPMVWLGTISRALQPRLPAAHHRLRGFERDGRVYELLGVRLFKWLLRRGPLAVFNPDLHLPRERTPESLARLDQRMKDAEASHFVLFALMFVVAVNAAAHGSWTTAGWILLFDLLMNGYPVMLQRYNRALLRKRFPAAPAAADACAAPVGRVGRAGWHAASRSDDRGQADGGRQPTATEAGA